MSESIKRIAVTGAAGQIAYNLLFRIASGEMLGQSQAVALHLLEIPAALGALEGVVMELKDCAFPLLREIHFGSDANEVFKAVDIALLVGSKPRGPGMERNDLLNENGKIFTGQGQALDTVASKDVKVFVVGNPCNTNCLIAMHAAPSIPRKNFHGMTRLDENRAKACLAEKASVAVKDLSNLCIWGNHSATQVPDFLHARIKGQPVTDLIKDEAWLKGEFFQTVQQRGAAIIKARGKSSAASAASALVDEVRSHYTPTKEGDFFSTAVISDGNTYGVKEGVIFSFPCRSKGDGDYEIVEGLAWDAFLKEKIASTEAELLQEREIVSDLLPTKLKS